jgi:hypothetical protein
LARSQAGGEGVIEGFACVRLLRRGFGEHSFALIAFVYLPPSGVSHPEPKAKGGGASLTQNSSHDCESLRTIAGRRKCLLADGGNLYLKSDGENRLSWQFTFKSPATGKQRAMGLGAAGAGGCHWPRPATPT